MYKVSKLGIEQWRNWPICCLRIDVVVTWPGKPYFYRMQQPGTEHV